MLNSPSLTLNSPSLLLISPSLVREGVFGAGQVGDCDGILRGWRPVRYAKICRRKPAVHDQRGVRHGHADTGEPLASTHQPLASTHQLLMLSEECVMDMLVQ
eukprot:1187346-Prorocentrum_minimum.AAC.1